MVGTCLCVVLASAGLAGMPMASAAASGTAGTWAIVASPQAQRFGLAFGGFYFRGISCVNSSFCVTVGPRPTSVTASSNTYSALIETYNGHVWSVMPSPKIANGHGYGSLNAVSCPSASFCVAVGIWSTGAVSPYHTLVETYNGSSWSITPSPNTSATDQDILTGVSCSSAKFCEAVGYYTTASNQAGATLVETYNGSSWSITPSPNEGNGIVRLLSVSCASSMFCMAAGGYDLPNSTKGLIETYNGFTWSVMPNPNPSGSTSRNYLYSGVSCVSAMFCEAVGAYSVNSYNSVGTLVETYDGSSWSITPSPNPNPNPGWGNFLDSVSCTSATFCAAVGSVDTLVGSVSPTLTLVETYNGSTWSVVSSPNVDTTLGTGQVPSPYNALQSVSCESASACAALGSYYYSTPPCYSGTSTTTKGNLIEATGALQVSSVPSMGYWTVASDGGIFSYGNAAFHGSMGGKHLNAPMVAMAATPSGKGYWTVASDGGIFSFGNAAFHGSMGGKHLNAPMVGIASGPRGCGYWTVAADGGIFSYGDSKFHGSMGGKHLNAPVVGMAPTPGGNGYWLVASDGGLFAFGTAQFYGSMGGRHLNSPVIGRVPTPDGKGYLLVAADGGVFAFGDAHFYGSQGGKPLNAPMVSIASTPDDQGYWTVASDGGVFNYGDARFYGSMGGRHLNAPMVGIAST